MLAYRLRRALDEMSPKSHQLSCKLLYEVRFFWVILIFRQSSGFLMVTTYRQPGFRFALIFNYFLVSCSERPGCRFWKILRISPAADLGHANPGVSFSKSRGYGSENTGKFLGERKSPRRGRRERIEF